GARDRQWQCKAQRRAPALRAGRHLPVAARCGQCRRPVRRGDPRPGQDDARPRTGDPRAQEVPGHEQAGAGGGQARRPAGYVLVHRPGERGAVPRHAAARGLLRRAHGADAEDLRRRRRPPVHGPRAGVALPQGGVLPRPGLYRRTSRARPGTRRALLAVATLTAFALALTFLWQPLREWWRGPPPSLPATSFDWQPRIAPLAGDGHRGLRDGHLLPARFNEPWGLVRGLDGSLFVADGGEANRIRRIAPDGRVTTFAGSSEGFADGIGTAAKFHTPSSLAIDRLGNLYVADTGNHAIRKISRNGQVTTLAGTGVPGFRDGDGALAQFRAPMGVAVDGGGRVYVAD